MFPFIRAPLPPVRHKASPRSRSCQQVTHQPGGIPRWQRLKPVSVVTSLSALVVILANAGSARVQVLGRNIRNLTSGVIASEATRVREDLKGFKAEIKDDVAGFKRNIRALNHKLDRVPGSPMTAKA